MALKNMVKESSSIIQYCDQVVRVSIYITVFLLPLFFAPWTFDVGNFNKQALLVLLSFIALVAWMLKTLVSGKFSIRSNKIHSALGALVLVFLLSTIFSVSSHISFWGVRQFSSQSFVSVMAFALIYFLVSNTFSEKEVVASYSLLGISSAIALGYGILQLAGLHSIPLGFANNNSFNTIGSVGSLGFFAVSLLPLCMIFTIITKKWWKGLFVADIFLVLVTLLMVNYTFLWLLGAIGSLLILLFWAMRREAFDARWMGLPIFFLVVSLFFIMINPQITWLSKNSLEVSLSSRANLGIAAQSLKSFGILGSGPGTFSYDFAKYKNKDFNQTSLWSVNFNSGASKVLTNITEIGIVGSLILLLTMALPIFYGVKYLMGQPGKQEAQKMYLVLGILAVLVSQTAGYFLYNANVSLDFIYFFALGSMVALLFKNTQTYSLTSSSLSTMAVIIIFVAVFIFDLGVLFMGSQRYLADINYHRGLVLFSQGKKDESLRYLKMATSQANSDLYFNQLALFSLARVQDELANTNSQNQAKVKQTIQALIADAVNASNASVVLSPQNYENWASRGYLCQNLIGVFPSAPNCAIQSYDKAISLNPNNPYLSMQEGNVYLAQAINLPQDQSQNKNDLLAQAKSKFNQAIALKQDYAPVYFQLASVFRSEGNTVEAAAALESAQKYASSDAVLYFQIGLAYYQDKNWLKAQDNFQAALGLVPNYANALYYSGLIYDKQGQKDNAISQFSKLLTLQVKKEDIQKMIDNVKAGKPATEGLVQQAPVPVEKSAQPPAENVVVPPLTETKK